MTGKQCEVVKAKLIDCRRCCWHGTYAVGFVDALGMISRAGLYGIMSRLRFFGQLRLRARRAIPVVASPCSGRFFTFAIVSQDTCAKIQKELIASLRLLLLPVHDHDHVCGFKRTVSTQIRIEETARAPLPWLSIADVGSHQRRYASGALVNKLRPKWIARGCGRIPQTINLSDTSDISFLSLVTLRFTNWYLRQCPENASILK